MKRAPLPPGFGSLWLAVAVDAIGFGIVIPILPLYAERFDASPAVIGLLLASFSLAQFVAAPRWGRVSDAMGRKPALIVSLGGTAFGSLLTAVAPSVALLFLGRIIDGASGGSLPVAQAAVSDLASPQDRPRLLGLLGAAFGAGFVVGPALGGLAALFGPRVPFFVAAALACGNAVLASRRLARVAPRRTAPPEVSVRSGRPPRLSSLLAVGFMSTAAFGAFESTFALFGARRLGLTLSTASLVFVAAGIVMVGANMRLVGPLTERFGTTGALRVGLGLNAAGLGAIAGADSALVLAVAIALLATGQGVAAPALAAAVASKAGPEHRGVALGRQQAAASLARVVAPAAAGAAFGSIGAGAPFVAGAGLALAAVFLAAAAAPRRDSVPAAAVAGDLA